MVPSEKYRICSRNFRPRVFFGFIFARRISRTIILLFLIGVVQLAPQHEVASRTHRSPNYQLNIYYVLVDFFFLMPPHVHTKFRGPPSWLWQKWKRLLRLGRPFSLIIVYWIDNGIYSAFIMIIINLIIDKSILCYKITIKYWQCTIFSIILE